MSVNMMEAQDRMMEVKTELAQKCAQDSAFRQALISDPSATIEAEYELPAGSMGELTVNVVVEEPGSIVLPIPPDISEMELTDEQLDQVAGGAAFGAAVAAVIGAAVAGGIAVNREVRRGGRRGW